MFNKKELSSITEKLDSALAMATLGLTAGFTDAELKKAYKRASIKSHPDKGGTIEKSQLTNLSYEFLKKADAPIDFNARKAERKAEQQRAYVFAEELFQKFDANAYKSYLESFTKTVLMFTESKTTVGSFNETFKLWKFDDGKSFFEIKVYAQILFPKNALAGATGAMLDKMSTTTSVLVNRKKYKMTQSDWGMQNVAKMFKSPEVLFPKAKLKKIYASDAKVKPVKKADYLLSFKQELKAQISGTNIRIPMKNGSTIYMDRITWMRKGVYQLSSIYSNTKPRERTLVFASFYETTEAKTLDWIVDTLKKAQSMTDAKAKMFIEAEYKKQG